MENNKKNRGLYRKLFYVAFFLIVFIVALGRLFPTEKLRNLFEVRLSEASTCDVEIKGLRFSLIGGLRFTGISFDRDIKGNGENVLNIDELTIKPYYTSLLSDKVKVKVESKLYGGEMIGDINFFKSNGYGVSNLKLSFEHIDISKNKLMASLYGVDAYGLVDGEVSFTDLSGGLMGIKGGGGIVITDGGVRGITINKLGSGLLNFNNMKLPDITFKKVDIGFTKDDRVVKVERFKVEGDDINANINGSINLNSNIKASSGNLNLKLSLSNEFTKKNDILSIIDESFKSLKDAKGFYNMKIEGQLLKPRVRTL